MIATPPIARRLVGGALRSYRQSLGYALDDAARVLDCDRSKVSRIETGQRGIRRRELTDLLTEYGASDEARDTLTAIISPQTQRGWWRDFTGMLPDTRRDYLALETVASQVFIYEGQRVPELLQTQAYTRALAETSAVLRDDLTPDAAARAALARQQAILTSGTRDVRMVIGEAALRQDIGGTAVMKEQIAAIGAASQDTRPVTVQVLPFSAGIVDVGNCSLAILRFSGLPACGLVYLDDAAGGICRDDPAALAAYAKVSGQLRSSALTPQASARLLRDLAA
jgi:transcriptional regulator with XRE-family HTH domain